MKVICTQSLNIYNLLKEYHSTNHSSCYKDTIYYIDLFMNVKINMSLSVLVIIKKVKVRARIAHIKDTAYVSLFLQPLATHLQYSERYSRGQLVLVALCV